MLLINEGAATETTSTSAQPMQQPEAAVYDPQTEANQQKMMAMSRCAQEALANGVAGAARKTFMSSCLSAKGLSQEDVNKLQQKMKNCQGDAKGLTGDDRKAFIKSCLNAPPGTGR